MIIAFSLSLLSTSKPVIRLEDSLIRGRIRQPNLVELEASDLDRRIEEAALKSLIRLENQLLEARPFSLKNTKAPHSKP